MRRITAPGSDFTRVGDIFSDERNPERKKPFDVRTVMRAVIDQDHAPLERWPRCARPRSRWSGTPTWAATPSRCSGSSPDRCHGAGSSRPTARSSGRRARSSRASSKKVARAINAASGNRPVVVLANLSGFDGSPESLREWQLEYGAEIGRAVVNFDGPIVFGVISRYHGGAFVVFSQALNESVEVVAVEGSYASVIGGAPAAAVCSPAR